MYSITYCLNDSSCFLSIFPASCFLGEGSEHRKDRIIRWGYKANVIDYATLIRFDFVEIVIFSAVQYVVKLRFREIFAEQIEHQPVNCLHMTLHVAKGVWA